MKKLLLSIALVLSAGNVFAMYNSGGSLLIGGGPPKPDPRFENVHVMGPDGKEIQLNKPAQQVFVANPGPTLDANCIPSGYRTSSSLGNTGGMAMSIAAPQQISFGNPNYNAYADCMRKKGLQPAQALWK